MRQYIGFALSISFVGIIIAKALWPCLQIIPWSPILLIFAIILGMTLITHMSKWKCWSYICQERRRLQSSGHAQIGIGDIPYHIIIGIITCTWSTAYALIAINISACHVTWWPALICPACIFIYTVAVTSSNSSCCSSPDTSLALDSLEPSPGSSSENTDGSGSGWADCSSTESSLDDNTGDVSNPKSISSSLSET